jgi:hypothetical protein
VRALVRVLVGASVGAFVETFLRACLWVAPGGQVSERWLTYDEMADALGITKASARVHARRRRWPRRPGNDGRARIGVPEEEIAARTVPESSSLSAPSNAPRSAPKKAPRSNTELTADARALIALLEGRVSELTAESKEVRVTIDALTAKAARVDVLESQIESLNALVAVEREHADRERQLLEKAVADAAADRDRWAAQATQLAATQSHPAPRGWWLFRRSA